MKTFFLLAIFIIFLVSGCAAQNALPHATHDHKSIEVTQAAFGLFPSEESGRTKFVSSTKIPFVVGESYGWVLTVKTSRKTVKYRDELTLPKPITQWGQPTGAEQMVASDGKSAVAEREASVENGQIHGGWGIADSDPRGRYVSKVTLEDGQTLVFEFDVE